MSYSESEVKIENPLTKLCDGVEILFTIDKKIDINNIYEVSTSITLDIVYLKKNINIENEITKENDKIRVKINKFPLEKENPIELMNIATLNFIFYDNNKKVLDEKKLIVQIFREKNDIFKNII
jgi:hypothetical protein